MCSCLVLLPPPGPVQKQRGLGSHRYPRGQWRGAGRTERERERFVSSLSLSGFFADINSHKQDGPESSLPSWDWTWHRIFLPPQQPRLCSQRATQKTERNRIGCLDLQTAKFSQFKLVTFTTMQFPNKAKSTDSTRRSYLKHQKNWCEGNTGQTHRLSSGCVPVPSGHDFIGTEIIYLM